MNRIFFILLFLTAFPVSRAAAQEYTIERSVIAGGGGISSGGSFSVTGTIGQAVTLPNAASSSPPTLVFSGFWTPDQLIPTSAPVSIGGHVISTAGTPISRASIQLINAGGEIRSVMTNQFGRFRFDSIPAGDTYIIQVTHRTFVFQSLAVSIQAGVADLEIVSLN